MSCAVCAGYIDTHCPVCGDAQCVTCPDCQGSGYTPYKALDIRTRKEVAVTELAWRILPDDEDEAESKRMRYCKMEIEICPMCKGEGEIRK